MVKTTPTQNLLQQSQAYNRISPHLPRQLKNGHIIYKLSHLIPSQKKLDEMYATIILYARTTQPKKTQDFLGDEPSTKKTVVKVAGTAVSLAAIAYLIGPGTAAAAGLAVCTYAASAHRENSVRREALAQRLMSNPFTDVSEFAKKYSGQKSTPPSPPSSSSRTTYIPGT